MECYTIGGGAPMNKAATLEPDSEETRTIETEMERIFLQIERIDERITKDQQEIDRLTVKTRRMLDELKAR
jgi:uncharacterized protein YaaN involved in tellurite resistance